MRVPEKIILIELFVPCLTVGMYNAALEGAMALFKGFFGALLDIAKFLQGKKSILKNVFKKYIH